MPAAATEIAAVVAHFRSSQILRHAEATRHAALAALPFAEVAHFACHGNADLINPLESSLLLAHDEVLTIRDLFEIHLAGARLATLSACETAMVSTHLSDEVVALPSAFLRAGFAGVAASLWAVSDLSSALVMQHFYHLWRVEGREPPEALRQAQIWVRETTNGQKKAYYRQYLPMFSRLTDDEVRLPATVAEMLFRIFALEEEDVQAFAHPFFWATFQYVGV